LPRSRQAALKPYREVIFTRRGLSVYLWVCILYCKNSAVFSRCYPDGGGMEQKQNNNSDINQMRDELKLKAHLFKMETRDLWDDLEQKWEKLTQESGVARGAVEKTAKNVGAATSLLVDELKEGYERIKRSISS
ncbi:MAG: hypothetical protein KDD35_09470, partial [Bdellovibrionales bacterium]|nr:hypothetical protein [Bdellovibrionales bacterium]